MCRPASQLNSDDLPTFGRPTIATHGTATGPDSLSERRFPFSREPRASATIPLARGSRLNAKGIYTPLRLRRVRRARRCSRRGGTRTCPRCLDEGGAAEQQEPGKGMRCQVVEAICKGKSWVRNMPRKKAIAQHHKDPEPKDVAVRGSTRRRQAPKPSVGASRMYVQPSVQGPSTSIQQQLRPMPEDANRGRDQPAQRPARDQTGEGGRNADLQDLVGPWRESGLPTKP